MQQTYSEHSTTPAINSNKSERGCPTCVNADVTLVMDGAYADVRSLAESVMLWLNAAVLVTLLVMVALKGAS